MKVAAVVACYNSGANLTRVADALLDQTLPNGCDYEVVFVDDGSDDGSTNRLGERLGSRGRLVRLATNQGRCAARNAGAAAAVDADLLLFVDGDCIATPDLLVTHVGEFADGVDVSFGDILTPGDSFWAKLQQDVSTRRGRRFRMGDAWSFTTANVAIRRELFAAVGGFDLAFNRHGFEDRDLFVRLTEAGARLAFNGNAAVLHADNVSLESVSRKLGEAGFHAAHIFRTRHPSTYSQMAFSRLDCGIHPSLLAADRLAWPVARWLGTRPNDKWLEWNKVPFAARALIARTVYGLWFLHGTAERIRTTPGGI